MMAGGMDFAAARSKVRGLVASKRPQDQQRSVLTPDVLRDNVIAEEAEHVERFKSALGRNPIIKYEATVTDADGNETKEQREYEWSSFPEMLRDVARAGYGFDEPEVADAMRVKPSHRLNREIMAQRLISEGVQESRPYTRGNPAEALYGALAEAEDLRESARTRLAEHIARSEEMAEAEDELGAADDMMQQLRDLAQAQQQANGQVDPQTWDDLKNASRGRSTARDRLANLIQQQAQSTMVADAIAAAESAAKAGAEAVDAFSNLPGNESGAGANLSVDRQIELAEKWGSNSRLREIAKMLGRMYRDMRFHRETRVKNVPIEPVGVTVGDHLTRILPMESARAMSDDPLQKFTFVRDWMAGHLLEYEMSGKMPAGKGPCIAVVDGSGSMNGAKIVWAWSLTLSLMQMMHREKRDFAAIQFGHGANEVKVWHFPKGVAPDPDEVIAMASFLWNGGTTTVEGMAAALAIVENVPEFKTADVVLLADGCDRWQAKDTQVRDALRAKDVRIHGISILSKGNTYMQQMCEYVEDVTDLAGANDTTTKLAANIT